LSKLLIAGVNEITEDEWEQIKDHPALPEMFNSDPEKLEWVEGRGPEDTVHETPESGNILSSMTEKQAIKVIRGTLSKDLLDKWYLSESRSTVKAEIEKQFDKLKMPEEKK
jgi:hypothetical protein